METKSIVMKGNIKTIFRSDMHSGPEFESFQTIRIKEGDVLSFDGNSIPDNFLDGFVEYQKRFETQTEPFAEDVEYQPGKTSDDFVQVVVIGFREIQSK